MDHFISCCLDFSQFFIVSVALHFVIYFTQLQQRGKRLAKRVLLAFVVILLN